MSRPVTRIVIHCTATHPNATVEAILNYWRNTLGWRNPGYHRIIRADGSCEQLHPFELVANGARGYNRSSIHISYIGGIDRDGLPKDTRTQAQQAALIVQVTRAQDWITDQGLPEAEIVGHRDLNPSKACPSFNAKRELGWLGS